MEFLAIDTFDSTKNATTRLQLEMERFRQDKGKSVTLSQLGWDDIWRELVSIGIYRRGPDLTEIGTTWLESLAAMQSLTPFSERDISAIGGKEIFFPAAWQNVASHTQNEIWGIPFRADTRVIFYWKDLLENASVDASEAFSTAESMEESFARLQKAGIFAWIAPTNGARTTVHSIASWIWGAGGDFLSADGKRTDLDSPAARRGIQAYFDLLRFMPQQTSPFTDLDAMQLFFARKAASMVAGPWLPYSLRLQNDMEQWMPYLGIALLPGPSFVGGSSLVIWKHAKNPTDAVDLIKQLTSTIFQSEYCLISAMLPARQDVWTDEFIRSHEYLPVFNNALRMGRGLPPTALWGIVEDRLSKTLAAIWQDLYALNMPGKQIDGLDGIVAKHLDALAARLDITLSA
jgi:multiple sugar transport system substrate-binding protein